MTNNEQKLRELVNGISAFTTRKELMERITALISEHYYPKDMVRWTFNQRFMACGHTGFDSSILELDLEYWNEHIKGKENER